MGELHKLVQDQSCHWYLIPLDLQDEFYKWEDMMETFGYVEDEVVDFNKYSIDSPQSIIIKSYDVV